MLFPFNIMGLAKILQAYFGFPPTAIFTLILAIVLWYLYQSRHARTLPPGPYSWPIIGNLHQLGMLPHRALQEFAKKYGPVTYLKLGSFSVIVVSSSEMAKVFFTTHDANFSSRPATAAGKYIGYNYKDVLFAPMGNYWREMRKICVVELLSAERVASLNYVRQEEVSTMIRSVWEESEHGTIPVNLRKILSSLTSCIMWRILTGSKYYSVDGRGKEIISEISSVAGAIAIGDYIPWLDWLDLQGIKGRMKSLHKSFDELIVKIIEEHVERRRINGTDVMNQNQRSKDIIDVLLELETAQSQRRVKITRDHIKAIVFDMFAGGMETTSTTLEWAMCSLIKSPAVLRKLQEEIQSVVGINGKIDEFDLANMEYLHCVAKEALRLYPTAPLLVPRESLEACNVVVGAQQYLIPERTRLIINAWAIGRDPTLWGDPLAFRPERFMGKNMNVGVQGKDSYDVISFGAGRRGCPGAPLATATLKLALVQLVHYFDWTVEGDPSALDMNEEFGLTMQRRVELIALPTLTMSGESIFSRQNGDSA